MRAKAAIKKAIGIQIEAKGFSPSSCRVPDSPQDVAHRQIWVRRCFPSSLGVKKDAQPRRPFKPFTPTFDREGRRVDRRRDRRSRPSAASSRTYRAQGRRVNCGRGRAAPRPRPCSLPARASTKATTTHIELRPGVPRREFARRRPSPTAVFPPRRRRTSRSPSTSPASQFGPTVSRVGPSSTTAARSRAAGLRGQEGLASPSPRSPGTRQAVSRTRGPGLSGRDRAPARLILTAVRMELKHKASSSRSTKARGRRQGRQG